MSRTSRARRAAVARATRASAAAALLAAALFAAVLLAAAGPPPAAAATVSIETRTTDSKGSTEAVVVWRAAPGERNVVTASDDAEGVVVRDAAAPIAAGRGCSARADGSVACAGWALDLIAGDGDDELLLTGTSSRVAASGGAGDDRVVVRGGPELQASVLGGDGDDLMNVESGVAALHGAEGDDVLRGGPSADSLSGDAGDDRLDGGGGDDTLQGGWGADELIGGDGDDRLDGRPIIEIYESVKDRAADRLHGGDGDDALASGYGDDLLDGGAGTDTVSYEERLRPVTADLALGAGGEPGRGERDTFVAVENLRGGFSADTLRGDDGPNRLAGGPYGRTWLPVWPRIDESSRRGDRLDGRGGDDLLLNAAAARDQRGRRPGSVVCGPGSDRVRPARGGDAIAADCEQVELLRGLLVRGWQLGSRDLTLTVTRTSAAGSYARSCGLVARLTGRGASGVRGSAVRARLPHRGARTLRLVAARPLPRRVGLALRLGRCDGRGGSARLDTTLALGR